MKYTAIKIFNIQIGNLNFFLLLNTYRVISFFSKFPRNVNISVSLAWCPGQKKQPHLWLSSMDVVTATKGLTALTPDGEFIPEGVADTYQIFIRNTHILPN
jgi:hypothetical protein